MTLSDELRKAIDDFDNTLDILLGKPSADEMRAYVRDKYSGVQTKDEEKKFENLYNKWKKDNLV